LPHRALAPDLQADEETKHNRVPTAFWCVRYQAIPIQLGCTFFRIEIFPPCKLTIRRTMTANPVAFWCLCYRATPIRLRCTFFYRMEISSVL
jgi:hypothetical protein